MKKPKLPLTIGLYGTGIYDADGSGLNKDETAWVKDFVSHHDELVEFVRAMRDETQSTNTKAWIDRLLDKLGAEKKG